MSENEMVAKIKRALDVMDAGKELTACGEARLLELDAEMTKLGYDIPALVIKAYEEL